MLEYLVIYAVIKLLKKPTTILFLILLIGLFFRTYQVIDRMEFSHDQDLFSWIAKDIIVNHHIRLIGQLTTAAGIFIGPLFYYSLVPFFLIFNMDPVGTIIPILLLAMLNLISYYCVFTKLFNSKVGLIIAFLQAVSLYFVGFDGRVVPSTPTNIWLVWYFYCLIMISRGKYSTLPLLGVLIGLIWHIHIALFPTLLAIPAAMFISKKLPTIKQITLFLVTLFISNLPLILFETRHNFSQTLSLINNLQTDHQGTTGLIKLDLNIQKVTKNLNSMLFYPLVFPFDTKILLGLMLLSPIFLIKKGLMKLKEIIPLYFLIFGVLAFFTVSSSPVAEYYFASFDIVFLCFISLILYYIFNLSKTGKYFVLLLFLLITCKNVYFLLHDDYYHKGYIEKKQLVKDIVADARNRNFPCVAISYITSPGENVGFRYFFWLDNLHIIHTSASVPTYTIVIPDELSEGSLAKKYGHVGLILPEHVPPQDQIDESCKGPNTNLTDPMLGYVE